MYEVPISRTLVCTYKYMAMCALCALTRTVFSQGTRVCTGSVVAVQSRRMEKTTCQIKKKKKTNREQPSESLLCGLYSLWSFGNLIGFHFSKIYPSISLSLSHCLSPQPPSPPARRALRSPSPIFIHLPVQPYLHSLTNTLSSVRPSMRALYHARCCFATVETYHYEPSNVFVVITMSFYDLNIM